MRKAKSPPKEYIAKSPPPSLALWKTPLEKHADRFMGIFTEKVVLSAIDTFIISRCIWSTCELCYRSAEFLISLFVTGE